MYCIETMPQIQNISSSHGRLRNVNLVGIDLILHGDSGTQTHPSCGSRAMLSSASSSKGRG